MSNAANEFLGVARKKTRSGDRARIASRRCHVGEIRFELILILIHNGIPRAVAEYFRVDRSCTNGL